MPLPAPAKALRHADFVSIVPIEAPVSEICYALYDSPFGQICIGATELGICKLDFAAGLEQGLELLKHSFPSSTLIHRKTAIQECGLGIFSGSTARITLHVQGTEFQVQVWNALLGIPKGQLSSYQKIAAMLGKPSASRAVGTAVGANPVGFVIPCHRVVRNDGSFGEFLWGRELKITLLNWEAGFQNPKLL